MTSQTYKYNSTIVMYLYAVYEKGSTMLENLIVSGQWISLIKNRWVKCFQTRADSLILLAAQPRKKGEARLQTGNRASLTRRLRQHIHHPSDFFHPVRLI